MFKSYREKVRIEIIQNLQENHQNSLKHTHSTFNKRLKFLNQFYLFNGLSKYYDHIVKLSNKGIIIDEETLKEAKRCLAILNSNLDNREGELMKVYNCNPEWPICLYDFTYKNKSNEYQTMKCRKKLSSYIVEDYIGINPKNKVLLESLVK